MPRPSHLRALVVTLERVEVIGAALSSLRVETAERTAEMQSQEERIALNDSTFREANEKIAGYATDHEFVQQVPFICECATESCLTIVDLSLAEYEEVRAEPTRFFVAPGHQGSEGAVSMLEDRERYVLIEKGGRAGEIATELDPRSLP